MKINEYIVPGDADYDYRDFEGEKMNKEKALATVLESAKQWEYFNDSGLIEDAHWMIDDLLEAQALATAEIIEKETLKRVGEKLENSYLHSTEWRTEVMKLINYLKHGELPEE